MCHYLFSFRHQQTTYPCALIEWFVPVGNEPCLNTGMWIVEPQIGLGERRVTLVIHVDSILCGAQLIGVYGDNHLPQEFKFTDTLDAFIAYYVNKFTDNYAYEIVF